MGFFSLMLKRYLLAIALLFMLVPAGLLAQQQGVRVAFVNINQIMEQSPQAEAAMQALEREFAPRDAELVAERDALQELQRRLERDIDVMAAEQRARLERDFRGRSRDFRRSQDIFQDDLNARRNEELATLQRLVHNVILELAQQEDVDLVVTERNVLFANDRIDITPRVLEALRAQSQQRN
ncbi:periplasmic chaperone for outer membrane proteins Skp [Ectothiorhodosinus mongolicus]|uniref:Periplasmic chaperone for outer membrane proteins Skp n=2 Tax=Ectothiorhodosinus mongolicus TaxID=233100 RepID=A0A1R3VN20_9GAMM|nr:periplasmic chaperone for outer membrane proteins Skp [Ectothiorhodosinus mongolicus]